MIDWVKKVLLLDYSNFSGRSRRSEFWYFYLFNTLFAFAIGILMGLVTALSNNPNDLGGFSYLLLGLYGLYGLYIIVPFFALAVRRLHDIGKSGWNLLWGLIPLVGSIVLLIFYCTDSQPGENKWGVNPKNDL